MSQPLEQISEAKQSSHEESEYTSISETKSEEGSTASEEDTFFSIWYPSPNFPTPYIHNQDFGDTDKALKYIMKVFNLQVIHNSLLAFPTLSRDIVYYGTYIDSDRFTTKQNQQIDL